MLCARTWGLIEKFEMVYFDLSSRGYYKYAYLVNTSYVLWEWVLYLEVILDYHIASHVVMTIDFEKKSKANQSY